MHRETDVAPRRSQPRAPWLIAAVLLLAATASAAERVQVLPGIEVLTRHHAARLVGRRVALLCDATAVDRNLRSTIDILHELRGVRLLLLLEPGRGLRGTRQRAPVQVSESGEHIDPHSGVPVVSIAKGFEAARADLRDKVNLVLYDVQHQGTRADPALRELGGLMRACEALGLELWVLDRPNPLGGSQVGGPVLVEQLAEGMGLFRLPQVHGLTAGEYARLLRERELPELELSVVAMEGWRRGMPFDETGLPWVPPAEDLPRPESCFFAAMTDTLARTGALSVGFGTSQPYELLGAPWLDGVALAEDMGRLALPGVMFRPTSFRPRIGVYGDTLCHGVQIHLTRPQLCNPAQVATALLRHLARTYADKELLRPREARTFGIFVTGLGDPALARALALGEDLAPIDARLAEDFRQYMRVRETVLIYPTVGRRHAESGR